MALSLPGERSLMSAMPVNPSAFLRWIAKAKAARNRRVALKALLELDHIRLNDLGISHADIADAVKASGKSGHVLHRARARSAGV